MPRNRSKPFWLARDRYAVLLGDRRLVMAPEGTYQAGYTGTFAPQPIKSLLGQFPPLGEQLRVCVVDYRYLRELERIARDAKGAKS